MSSSSFPLLQQVEQKKGTTDAYAVVGPSIEAAVQVLLDEAYVAPEQPPAAA